jgi:SprT protein
LVDELQGYSIELLDHLCAKFPLGYTPKLSWKKSLRVTAGVANYVKGEIALSSVVLTDRERVRITLLHEYAHLLAVKRHGRRAAGHGLHWQQAMRDLGLPPEVRHRYDVQRNGKRQKVIYCCLRCGTKLERSRRLPRRRKYVHATCGGDLRLEAVLVQQAA